MEKKSKSRNDRFKVRLSYEQHPQAELPLVGFLFNCHGRLLQWQLADDMELHFNLKEYPRDIQIDQLRLFVAPASDKRILSVTNLQQLETYKAYEPIMRSLTEGEVVVQPIPEQLSIYWLFCKCRVKGKLSKWFDEGNVWENKAVCNARVHICEIDPIQYWIQRIPDHIIAKIPEAILRPERLPEIPRPIPDPPPFGRIQRPQLEVAQENMFLKSSPMQRAEENMAKLPVLSADIKQNLATGNLATIRETVVNNYALLHPWFCFWPWWWPYFYRCKELAVVKTNASGRFDTTITYNCFGDKPDIYIWVEYFINGEWTTVYKPPVPCYTHWNYTCGSDINIQITHPEVPGDCCCNCGIGGDLVWVRTIRKHTSVSHILQTPLMQAPPDQDIKYQRIGLTDASAIGDPSIMNITVDDYKRPFGGTPMFYMGFGSDLPKNEIYHYRWSYRKVAEADLTPVANTFSALIPKGGVVNKGYDYEYLDPNNDKQIAPNSVKLGPYSVGANDNLYIIPDQDPKKFPFPAPEDNPVWHEPTYNMNTMQFDTTELEGDGQYEFMLELFDQAGNLLQNISRTTFKIPQHDNAGLSRNAPDDYLIDPTGTVEDGGIADAYKMLMRFDNQGVEGEIYTVNVDGEPASLDCCGFVNYKPDGVEADLELSFKATQQNDFAVFSFGVVKGTCGDVGDAIASGMVIDSADDYILGGGVYRKTFAPATLLGECYDEGEGKAAFGENLHIYTMATDGQFRVQRDLHDSAAFALEP